MTDKPAAPSPPEQRICLHPYLSTACLHGKHELCRRTCKFCDAPCQCRDCVHATSAPLPSAPATPFPELPTIPEEIFNALHEHDEAMERLTGADPPPLPSAPAITVHEAEQKLQWQASAVPAPSLGVPGAPAQQLYATEYPPNPALTGAAVPAPPSPAPIDRASWQAGVSAAIKEIANGRTINNFGHVPEVRRALEWVIMELQSLEPPFPAPVASGPAAEVPAPVIVAELRATRAAWHEKNGVPISWEYARFLEAIGKAEDALSGQRDDAVSSEVPQKGWISVKEKLPKDCQVVIALQAGNIPYNLRIKVCEYEITSPHGMHTETRFRLQGTLNEFKDVTHWQPLPDPPESEPK